MKFPDRVVPYYRVSMGTDPELFLARKGKVVGSEEAVPEGGIAGVVTRDGVQVELHPGPSACRETLASNLGRAFFALDQKLKVTDLNLSFDSLVNVGKEEFDKLAAKAKVFGCDKSYSPYTENGESTPITVNAAEYTQRHAGGHIHFGIAGNTKVFPSVAYDPQLAKLLARFMDYIVGNQLVLIDRDPGQVERRKHYGRAGEYRTPHWGFEYRTPSNFWLKSYPLMSLVFGLGRQAVHTWWATTKPLYRNGMVPADVEDKVKRIPWDQILFELVPPANIEQAINQNDAALATKNWEALKPFFHHAFATYPTGLIPHTIAGFEVLAETVGQKGLSYWFPDDPLQTWVDFATGKRNPENSHGWERFASDDLLVRKAA